MTHMLIVAYAPAAISLSHGFASSSCDWNLRASNARADSKMSCALILRHDACYECVETNMCILKRLFA
jgi:hypothetical protein